ncbi:MAG: hypothetical protein J2P19_14075, partial [Pseudonocardia sp.]|nr:hypothetical protein [Pseudonocardia sp.]
QTAKYTDDVGSTLDDSIAQITTAAEGLAAEAAQYEQAQASLSGEGFGEKVTGRFASAAEALQAAAEALKTSRDQIDSAKEQVSSAGSEMRSATKVFSDQQSVAESVAAAQQDAGVSKRTDFYAPA